MVEKVDNATLAALRDEGGEPLTVEDAPLDWWSVEEAEGLANAAIGKMKIPEWRAMVNDIARALQRERTRVTDKPATTDARDRAREIVDEWFDAKDGYRGMVLVDEERESLIRLIASALSIPESELIINELKRVEPPMASYKAVPLDERVRRVVNRLINLESVTPEPNGDAQLKSRAAERNTPSNPNN